MEDHRKFTIDNEQVGPARAIELLIEKVERLESAYISCDADIRYEGDRE